MYKVFITKREFDNGYDCDVIEEYVSVDAVKPYDISDDDWHYIKEQVKELATGKDESIKNLPANGCNYDLSCMIEDAEWGILAESEHFYIRGDNEDASLYQKSDSKRICSVGDFYGDPAAAYISHDERFCIIVGCGLIKYNLQEPFEEYMYDTETPQWVEYGRGPENIEWCDCIEEVTDKYVLVSAEGGNKRKYDLLTLRPYDENCSHKNED